MPNIWKKAKEKATGIYKEAKANPLKVMFPTSMTNPGVLGGDFLWQKYGPGSGGEGDTSIPVPGTSSFEDLLAQIAMDQYNMTRPLRGQFINDYMNVASGAVNPQNLPSYQPLFAQGKEAIEGQYGMAKDNILSNIARGGSMNQALTDLELGRAEAASSLPTEISQQIVNDMLNKASVAAFGAPVTAMQGLGSAAGSYSNRLSAQIAAQANMAAADRMAQAQGEAALWGALGSVGGGALAGALS